MKKKYKNRKLCSNCTNCISYKDSNKKKHPYCRIKCKDITDKSETCRYFNNRNKDVVKKIYRNSNMDLSNKRTSHWLWTD